MKRHTCISRNGGVRGGVWGAPVHEEMHNIYHILYLNPLLEHFLGGSDLIKSRSVQLVSLWWIGGRSEA